MARSAVVCAGLCVALGTSCVEDDPRRGAISIESARVEPADASARPANVAAGSFGGARAGVIGMRADGGTPDDLARSADASAGNVSDGSQRDAGDARAGNMGGGSLFDSFVEAGLLGPQPGARL